MRERLIELLDMNCGYTEETKAEDLADYLLKNGVVVLMRDGNNFNPDLYCPYCGNNLSALEESEEE